MAEQPNTPEQTYVIAFNAGLDAAQLVVADAIIGLKSVTDVDLLNKVSQSIAALIKKVPE